jgi:nitric oxide dioxygenase
MTPEQIARVQQSYLDLQDRLDVLGARFYARLFEANPELRALFSVEIPVQQVKFTDELAEIVASISQLDSFLGRAHELGVRHLDYGTRARHYAPVGEALLGALIEVGGDDLDEDTREAWRLAFNLVAEAMQQGAADAARRSRT